MKRHTTLGPRYKDPKGIRRRPNTTTFSFDQSWEENRAAFIARLTDAGWIMEDAQLDWEQIQQE